MVLAEEVRRLVGDDHHLHRCDDEAAEEVSGAEEEGEGDVEEEASREEGERRRSRQ